MLLDAMLGAKRTKPMIIAGPRDTEARMKEMMEIMLPGSNIMVPNFDLQWVELELMKSNPVGEHLNVTAYPTDHTVQTHPISLRDEAHLQVERRDVGRASVTARPRYQGQAPVILSGSEGF